MARITPEQQKAVERLAKTQDESALWDTIVVFQEHPFLTATAVYLKHDGTIADREDIYRTVKIKTIAV